MSEFLKPSQKFNSPTSSKCNHQKPSDFDHSDHFSQNFSSSSQKASITTNTCLNTDSASILARDNIFINNNRSLQGSSNFQVSDKGVRNSCRLQVGGKTPKVEFQLTNGHTRNNKTDKFVHFDNNNNTNTNYLDDIYPKKKRKGTMFLSKTQTTTQNYINSNMDEVDINNDTYLNRTKIHNMTLRRISRVPGPKESFRGLLPKNKILNKKIADKQIKKMNNQINNNNSNSSHNLVDTWQQSSMMRRYSKAAHGIEFELEELTNFGHHHETFDKSEDIQSYW